MTNVADMGEDGWPVLACLSYRRPGRVTTLGCFPSGVLVVRESEADEYERAGVPDGWTIRTVPDERDGNKARKQNAILEMFQGRDVVMVDDDYTRMGRVFGGGHKVTLDARRLTFMMQEGYTLARELGTVLWGVNVNQDTRHYYEYRPFATLTPVLGPFQAVTADLPADLRYDESVEPKEDYDFNLRVLQRYHCVVRLNMYHYVVDHGKREGGVVSYRTMEREREAGRRLRQRWGSRVITLRFDLPKSGAAGSGPSTAHIDAVCRVPLRGV